jgi:hypothetical protein
VALDPLLVILAAVGLILLGVLSYYVSHMGEHLVHQIKQEKDYRESNLLKDDDVTAEINQIRIEQLDQHQKNQP